MRVAAEVAVGCPVAGFLEAGGGGADGDEVGFFGAHHLAEVLVQTVDAPALAKSLTPIGVEVAAGDKVQPVAGTRGRGYRIRQGAVPCVVNGGSHAAQADDAYAIGLHARSSWKCVWAVATNYRRRGPSQRLGRRRTPR